MATILKIKRSSTNPTATPSGLGQGELAYGEGTSTYTDAQGANVTSFGKLFVGRGSETAGVATNIDIIGGKYFTDLLDHGHGTIVANSATIVDSAKKVNEWNVDNITLDGNTLSTTNANGNFVIDTNGTGDVILSGSSTIGNNLFKINDGSVDRFIVDSFSGAIDITSPTLSAADTLLNISSTWNNAGATFYGIDLDVTNTASASTSRLLNLSVGGTDKFNVDLDGNVYVAGGIISYGSSAITNILDNTTDAYVVREGTNHYIDIDTNDGAEKLTLGNNITSVDIVIEDNTTDAFVVKEGTNQYIAIDTTDGVELLTIGTANVDIDRDLNVDGGDITTNQTTFNLLNTNATTVNFAGAATSIDIGASTGTTSINNNLDVDLDLNVDGGDITTNQTTFNLLNTNATTVNAFGAATSIDIGASTGTTSINNNLDVDLDLNVDGGDITTNQTTFNLLNTNATTVNFAGAATVIEIGASTGTTNVNNDLDVDGDINIDGGDLTVSTTTFNLANTTATTVNAFGAATVIEIGSSTGTTNVNNDLDVDGDVNIDGGDLTVSTTTFNLATSNATTVNAFTSATSIDIGASTGTTSINNNLDVDLDLNVDGGDITTNQTTFNLLNTTAETVNFAGAATTINIGNASTEVDFGDLRIVGATIYSDNINAETITIDPFPAAGNSDGTVVIRGNLQVSGTTTTVNSTQMSINDPVFTLGDSISEKTVVSAAASGQPDISLDNVEGLNVGDIVSGNAAIPAGTTIIAIDTVNKVITLSNNLTAGIAASTNTVPQILTFTQGADDNKDRGIEFKYFNNGLKTGFFGYDESGTIEGAGTTYYFTYIPDATNADQVFSGTVGSAYFNTTKLEIGIHNGVPFFDQYKRLTTTAAAGTADITTSNQIMTVNSSGVPVWTTTIDGGTY
jgi:hypothetical protein